MAAPQPTVDEREAKEAEEFRTGPLSVLTTSVKTNSQVCVHTCGFACVLEYTRVASRVQQLGQRVEC